MQYYYVVLFNKSTISTFIKWLCVCSWSLIVVVGWGVVEEEEAGKGEWKEIAFQIRKQLVTSKLHWKPAMCEVKVRGRITETISIKWSKLMKESCGKDQSDQTKLPHWLSY